MIGLCSSAMLRNVFALQQKTTIFNNILVLLASAACALFTPAYLLDWHLVLGGV